MESSNEMKSVNTEAVELLGINDSSLPRTVSSLVVSVPRYLHQEPECLQAKQRELDNWKEFGVYKVVDDVGQKTINTNWVLVRKSNGIKARLCIRGDQEPNKESIRTDSPTVNKINIKLFYLIAVAQKWHVQTADVKAAFLQGADIERDVFVRPPIECRKPGKVWKMVKRAYGFVDASRGFYIELERNLLNLGCTVSSFDPAMYIYKSKTTGILSGIMLTHVDDLLHGSGNQEFLERVMIPLKQRFKFGSEDQNDFAYVGMHVVQHKDTIIVDQDGYVEDLEIPYLNSKQNMDTVLEEDQQAEFRAAVGRIGWVANSTRPDLAYDNLTLSMKLGNATIRDMKHACRVIKRLKCDSTQMKFVDIGPIDQWTLHGYGDAGFKSLPDKISSCGGQVILISNNERNLSCVVDWRSKKLKRVVSSSTAAEALAANDTLDSLVYVHSVLVETFGDVAKDIPLVLTTDAKNLHKSVISTSLVENLRLRTDVAILKDSLKSRELNKLTLVAGKRMIANVLTKKGAAGVELMSILRTCKI